MGRTPSIETEIYLARILNVKTKRSLLFVDIRIKNLASLIGEVWQADDWAGGKALRVVSWGAHPLFSLYYFFCTFSSHLYVNTEKWRLVASTLFCL